MVAIRGNIWLLGKKMAIAALNWQTHLSFFEKNGIQTANKTKLKSNAQLNAILYFFLLCFAWD